jgi:hypothetical protein
MSSTRLALLAAAAAALSTATPAAAQAEDGPALSGQVEDLCAAKSALATCNAFLRGALEGLTFGQVSATGGLVSFCLPADVQIGEIRDTFLTYLDDDPDRRLQDAGMSLLESLEGAYPCADEGDDDPDQDEGADAPAARVAMTVGHRRGG